MLTLPTLIFWGLLNIFKAFFEEKKIGTPSECQTLWIQIKTIRIQVLTVCYQQTTKVTPARKEALGLVLEEECFESTIYCPKKRIDRLSFLIIGVQSTERNLKLLKMKKVNKQCLLDTPRTVRVSEKTWQVIVRTRRP